MGFGGGGGDQTVTQKFEPPSYTLSGSPQTATYGWQDFVNGIPGVTDWLMNSPEGQGTWEGGTPWTNGQWNAGQEAQNAVTGRVADLNSYTKQGMGNIAGMANDPLYGNDINGYMRGILNGNGSNWGVIQDWVNPYASAGNAYGGETNPAFEASLAAGRRNAEDTYNRTTNAGTMAAAAQTGAFGGSAYNELMGANQRALQDSLNQTESQARANQYNQAANLEESRLGRGFQGTENYYNRGMQDYSQMLGAEMQALGQMPGISQMQTGRQQALLGVGDIQNTYEQSVLDALQQWKMQQQQQGLLPWDVISSMLGKASGQGGQQTTQTVANMSPWQTLAGLGLLGAGAYTGLSGSKP